MKLSDEVTQSVGVAGLAFLISAPAALAIGWLLTEVYRRALRREMRASAAESAKRAVANALQPSSSRSPRPSTTSSGPPSSRRSSSGELVGASERWLRRRLYAIASLCLAGLVYVLVTCVFLRYLAKGDWALAATLRIALVQFVPFVLLLGLFFSSSRAGLATGLSLYIVTIAGFGLLSTHEFAAVLGSLSPLLPLGFAFVFLFRPLRGVGALSWALALVMLSTASTTMVWLESHAPGAAELAIELGLTTPAAVALLLLLGAAPMTLISWPLLRGLGKLYRERWLSDQVMIADSLVFICSLSNAIVFARANNSLTRAALALGPFLAYWLVLRSLNRSLSVEARSTRPLRLLYLRVFATGPDPGRVFSALAQSWCYAGTVAVLGGADLVAIPPQPLTLLDFLSGRLRFRFADDAAGVGRSIASFHERPDFQGRFAINELYCREGTWKHALARVAARSDVVLIDLRGFTRKRAGARFELAELAAAGQLRRSVLMVDSTSDQALISETIDTARKSSDGSPTTLSFPNGRIRLQPMMDALLHAAGAEGFRAEPSVQRA